MVQAGLYTRAVVRASNPPAPVKGLEHGGGLDQVANGAVMGHQRSDRAGPVAVGP